MSEMIKSELNSEEIQLTPEEISKLRAKVDKVFPKGTKPEEVADYLAEEYWVYG